MPGDPGGFLRTLLLSGLAALLFSGMEDAMAGSDIFRVGAGGTGGTGGPVGPAGPG